MNILLSLADNLSTFWEFSGFANATPGHLIMIGIGLFFIFLAVNQARIWMKPAEAGTVALSSISKARYLNRALAAGVDAYESKIDKEQLRITLERVLSASGESSGGRMLGLPERTVGADLFDLDGLESESFSKEYR